jgi:hypothetical protein
MKSFMNQFGNSMTTKSRQNSAIKSFNDNTPRMYFGKTGGIQNSVLNVLPDTKFYESFNGSK